MREDVICQECGDTVTLKVSSDGGRLSLSCDCSSFYSQHLDALQHPGFMPDKWNPQT